jgi:hypothetical protein
VLLEALASGLPVAAFPASGPKDVLTEPDIGVMSFDLKAAMLEALTLDREAAREHALRYSWENSARQFIDNVLAAHHIGLPERRRGRRRQKNTARLGGTGPSYTHASVWGTLGGSRVLPEMVGGSGNFKNPRAQSLL